MHNFKEVIRNMRFPKIFMIMSHVENNTTVAHHSERLSWNHKTYVIITTDVYCRGNFIYWFWPAGSEIELGACASNMANADEMSF